MGTGAADVPAPTRLFVPVCRTHREWIRRVTETPERSAAVVRERPNVRHRRWWYRRCWWYDDVQVEEEQPRVLLELGRRFRFRFRFGFGFGFGLFLVHSDDSDSYESSSYD